MGVRLEINVWGWVVSNAAAAWAEAEASRKCEVARPAIDAKPKARV